MKIEPIKKAILPKYAAALAMLTAVPALTGCGDTRLAGKVAVRTEPESSVVELGGDDVVYTEPEIAGGESFCPDTSPVVELDGEAPADYEPETVQQEPLTPETFAEAHITAFRAAFARQGMNAEYLPLRRDNSSPMDVRLGDGAFTAAFLHDGGIDDMVAVCFYDGSEALEYWDGYNMVSGTYADMIASLTEQKTAEACPWGCAAVTDMVKTADNLPICRAAFVDISLVDSLNEDDAEQILMDTLSALGDGENNEA